MGQSELWPFPVDALRQILDFSFRHGSWEAGMQFELKSQLFSNIDIATEFQTLMRLNWHAASASTGDTLIQLMVAYSVFMDTLNGRILSTNILQPRPLDAAFFYTVI